MAARTDTSPTGDVGELLVGAGNLYIAPYGTTLPVDFDDTLDAAFTELGFTTSGHTWSYQSSPSELRVAERLRPVKFVPGSSTASFSCTLAQYSPANIQKAIPGTEVAASVSGDSVKVTIPKAAGQERYSLIHVSESGLVVHVFTKCLISMSGESAFSSVDSADVAGISIEASIEEAGVGEDDIFILFDSASYDTGS